MLQKYWLSKLVFIIATFILISWSRIEHQVIVFAYPTLKTESGIAFINPVITDTSVCDKMFDGKFLESSQITLLNLGGAYPNQKMTVVIKGSDRKKFKTPPGTLYVGKTICVKGLIQIYKGRSEIVVTDPQQIVIQ
jgi:hypothetical protein